MSEIVTKKVLDIYFKYDNDLSLLHEPWARKKDKEAVSSEQANILGQYIDKLEFSKVDNLSDSLRKENQNRINELEKYIEEEVITILKHKLSI